MINATDAQQHEDVAVLLVATTLVFGPDRAIAAARASRGDEDLAAMLPGLQTAALGGELRQQVRHERLKVGDLREQTAAALGTEVPPVEQRTRVSWKSALMVVFVGCAAYTLTAVGVPEIAVSAVTVYRLISYCLPPIWGSTFRSAGSFATTICSGERAACCGALTSGSSLVLASPGSGILLPAGWRPSWPHR